MTEILKTTIPNLTVMPRAIGSTDLFLVNIPTGLAAGTYKVTAETLLAWAQAGLVTTSSIVNVLTSTSTNVPVSAAQAKILKDLIDTLTTDEVTEGSTNKYFTDARVRAAVLTGLSLATGTAITAADSVLAAFGKLQKQITDIITNSRYIVEDDAGATYTVAASKVTYNGRYILRLTNSSLSNITINTSTGSGVTAGDSVSVYITGTYAAQTLAASGVTLNGNLAFSSTTKLKTLVYEGSNTWLVLG
ncbi:hypothetical protein [Polynucleobacter sp.]|uniref:hypothetical protein n=1 Tax=Polynucleobacter sp. TaxID=2029855 RepID=UPI003F69C4C8